jgi:hypothetical protein
MPEKGTAGSLTLWIPEAQPVLAGGMAIPSASIWLREDFQRQGRQGCAKDAKALSRASARSFPFVDVHASPTRIVSQEAVRR